MSKERKSKLDAFAESLDAWLGIEKKSLAEAQAQLKLDGCEVSLGRLSEWWSARESQRMQNELLGLVKSGARQVQGLEKELGENPAPALKTIMELHRVLILQLATKSQANAEMMKLADQLTRTVLDYQSGQTKAEIEKQKLAQSERKLVLLEKKAAAFDQAKQVIESTLSPEEQRNRLREILK